MVNNYDGFVGQVTEVGSKPPSSNNLGELEDGKSRNA